MSKKGKITQIIGAVVDVNFDANLPEIYTALEVKNSGNKLILELFKSTGVPSSVANEFVKKERNTRDKKYF